MIHNEGDRVVTLFLASQVVAFLSEVVVAALAALESVDLSDDDEVVAGAAVEVFDLLISLKTPETFIIAANRVTTVDNPMAARMQAMGARVSIRRTMTPAKYQARVPYRMMKIAPSVILENRKNKPTGAKGTKMCKSKKNDVQVVG
jgi:hypothetical protein